MAKEEVLHIAVHLLTHQFLSQAQDLMLGYPEVFSKTDIKGYRMDLKSFLDQDVRNILHSTFLVLTDGKTVYGLIGYAKDNDSHNFYKIEWLVIKNGFENRGYGSLLVFAALKRIREEGGRHVYLMTSNERHNKKAQHFYEKTGFEKMGVFPDFFDPPLKDFKKLEDAVVYQRAL